MDNNARLKFLLNYMHSDILKRFLRDECMRDEYRTASYYLPYLQVEDSLFTHVLDVGYLVREIWEMKEKSLNYDYLVTGSLLHEYKRIDETILDRLLVLLRDNKVPELAQKLIADVVCAPLAEEEDILSIKTAEAVIIRHAIKLADIMPVCDLAADVKNGQKYYPLYPKVPILIRPVDIK